MVQAGVLVVVRTARVVHLVLARQEVVDRAVHKEGDVTGLSDGDRV